MDGFKICLKLKIVRIDEGYSKGVRKKGMLWVILYFWYKYYYDVMK